MRVATDKKITALADACLFHEKQKPREKLEEMTKEEYKIQVEAQELNLLYWKYLCEISSKNLPFLDGASMALYGTGVASGDPYFSFEE